MERLDDGCFSRPEVAGSLADNPDTTDTVNLGVDWTLQESATRPKARG